MQWVTLFHAAAYLFFSLFLPLPGSKHGLGRTSKKPYYNTIKEKSRTNEALGSPHKLCRVGGPHGGSFRPAQSDPDSKKRSACGTQQRINRTETSFSIPSFPFRRARLHTLAISNASANFLTAPSPLLRPITLQTNSIANKFVWHGGIHSPPTRRELPATQKKLARAATKSLRPPGN